MEKQPISVLVVGGGFAGITAALRLSKKLPGAMITLVNPRPYFEYYPAMYRVVTGSSPLQACVPLSEIFSCCSNVNLVQDSIVDIDPRTRTAIGASGRTYEAEYAIVAVGTENTYFNIKGVEEHSFSFKSIPQALRLRKRLHELFERAQTMETEERLLSLHFVVVGGGPSGTELAGEMAHYTRKLARKHGIPETFVTVDLVEAAPRILPAMPEEVSEKALRRLRRLGVNVYPNRILVKSESWTVFMKDMNVGAKTLVWTAGIKANSLFTKLTELEYDGKGRVVVDEYLQAKGYGDFYIAGDNASTQFSGLAQTAITDGTFIADDIIARVRRKARPIYESKPVAYDVPIGPGWGVLVIGKVKIYGWIPWWMRHIIDLRFFLSILPFGKALRYFFSGNTVDAKNYD